MVDDCDDEASSSELEPDLLAHVGFPRKLPLLSQDLALCDRRIQSVCDPEPTAGRVKMPCAELGIARLQSANQGVRDRSAKRHGRGNVSSILYAAGIRGSLTTSAWRGIG